NNDGYVIGGMSRLVNAVLNAYSGDLRVGNPVKKIVVEDGRAVGVMVGDQFTSGKYIVSNVPLWDLPNLLPPNIADGWFKKHSNFQPTYGVTRWLGLRKPVFNDRKTRIVVFPKPSCWLISLTAYDPNLAPKGRELVAIASVAFKGDDPHQIMNRVQEKVLSKLYPGLVDERNIEMDHIQHSYATRAAFIPGQGLKDRPGPETPINSLYIVGTDTGGEGVGLQHAAKSAERCISKIIEIKKVDNKLL
ncbi:MAG: FAD-dependent oxidoreductase, partial [Candidatus Hodarchaeota archaeon]